jgi:hypothetical protein
MEYFPWWVATSRSRAVVAFDIQVGSGIRVKLEGRLGKF